MAAPSTNFTLMDILFDRDDPMLKLMDDKELFAADAFRNDKVDNWMNCDDDLLKDILKNDLDVLDDNLGLEGTRESGLSSWHMEDNVKVKVETIATSSDCPSDSGYSNDHGSPGLPHDYEFSPPRREDDDDQMSSTISITSDSSINMADDIEPTSSNYGGGVTVAAEPPVKKVRQVMKVSPMLASNPRSVLLPVNTPNGVRTYKIVSPAGGIKTIKPANSAATGQLVFKSVRQSVLPTVSRVNRSNGKLKRRQSRMVRGSSPGLHVPQVGDSDEEISVVSEGEEERMYEKQQYPRLILSSEERKLMQKEGVSLPSHYPLTKFEERELKRIRRKIRNKISAQDSRKRKKEYLDGLEDRVRQCTQENLSLVKKIKCLQSHNQSLMAQLKKLQATLAGKTNKTAQPATCLLVLILSVALVMAPNLRLSQPSENDVAAAEQDALSEKALPPIAGRSRSLLSSEAVIEEELLSLGSEQEVPAELHELLRFHKTEMIGSEGPGNKKSSMSWADAPHFLADHDYGPPPIKRRFTGTENTLIPQPVDDVWPPPPIKRVLEPSKLIIPDVDDEWLPKSNGIINQFEGRTTEVKVNISDGSGTRTVVIQVPKEDK